MMYFELLQKAFEQFEKEATKENIDLKSSELLNNFIIMITVELTHIADELHIKNRNDAARSNYELGLITREEMNRIVANEKE